MEKTEPGQRRPALRIVHLAGGLRAFDLGDPEISVGVDFQRKLLTIPSQPYKRLYAALRSIGLQPIGVDFISGRSKLEMHLPPDFQPMSLDSGFSTLWGERAWSDVKNVSSQRKREVLSISGRFSTYHRLLNVRFRQLSEAYRSALLAQLTDIDGSYSPPEDGVLFQNGHQVYIESAIHGFLADAAGFRDLIGEAIWKLVLCEDREDVTTFATFLKRTRERKNDLTLLVEMHDAGADGGWIKNLTELRNSIMHIAPLANTHELHECQMRLKPLSGGAVPTLHYPLTLPNGSIRPRLDPIDFDDREELAERLRIYHEFASNSGDALEYAGQCLDRLVQTATKIRDAAGLKHQMRRITDDDIVGPIRIIGDVSHD